MIRALAAVLLANAASAACVIQGTVIDAASGKPLANARVFARPPFDSHQPAILRATDAQGNFCFERLKPGNYAIIAGHTGHLDYVYGALPGKAPGTDLPVDGQGELPNLKLRMLRTTSIAGSVLDPDGEPIESADVTLWRKIWDKHWDWDSVAETHTDDRGAFRFPLLAPGTYYLSATPPGEAGTKVLGDKGQTINVSRISTYYSGSASLAHAAAIPLKAGEDLANLVLSLNQGAPRRLSGRLSDSFARTRGQPTTLMLDSAAARGAAIEIRSDGAFSAEGLEPQKYDAWVSGVLPRVEMEIDLTAGDLEGLIIEPKRSFDFPISVTAGKTDGQFALYALDVEKGVEKTSSARPDGSFYFQSVPPGLYVIYGAPKGQYLKNLVIEGKPRPDAVLDLRTSAPSSVQAVMGAGVVHIEGMLDRPAVAAELAVTVVCVDQEKPGSLIATRFIEAGSSGKFQIESLAPGKYRLFAIEGFDSELWGSPELAAALREKSRALELHESESRGVGLPVISLDEWGTALRKAGM